MDLKSFIRDVPDFPIKGIVFKDITTLLENSNAFNNAINKGLISAPIVLGRDHHDV